MTSIVTDVDKLTVDLTATESELRSEVSRAVAVEGELRAALTTQLQAAINDLDQLVAAGHERVNVSFASVTLALSELRANNLDRTALDSRYQRQCTNGESWDSGAQKCDRQVVQLGDSSTECSNETVGLLIYRRVEEDHALLICNGKDFIQIVGGPAENCRTHALSRNLDTEEPFIATLKPPGFTKIITVTCMPAGSPLDFIVHSTGNVPEDTTFGSGTHDPATAYRIVEAISNKGATDVEVRNADGSNVTPFTGTVLLIQMQDSTNADRVGLWEMNNVVGFSNNKAQLAQPIKHSYASNKFNVPLGSVVAQMIRVVLTKDLKVDGTLTTKPWNGFTGGVLPILATGTVVVNGRIHVDAVGFRGGAWWQASGGCNAHGSAGFQGESWTGLGVRLGKLIGSGCCTGSVNVLAPDGVADPNAGGGGGGEKLKIKIRTKIRFHILLLFCVMVDREGEYFSGARSCCLSFHSSLSLLSCPSTISFRLLVNLFEPRYTGSGACHGGGGSGGAYGEWTGLTRCPSGCSMPGAVGFGKRKQTLNWQTPEAMVQNCSGLELYYDPNLSLLSNRTLCVLVFPFVLLGGPECTRPGFVSRRGVSYGDNALDRVLMGSGGGAGNSYSPTSDPLPAEYNRNDGGRGAGALFLFSVGQITVQGSVTANGQQGYPLEGTAAYNWWIQDNSQDGSGGAGSGGALYLSSIGSTASLGTNKGLTVSSSGLFVNSSLSGENTSSLPPHTSKWYFSWI